jgi:hypothetical protein
MHNQDVTPGQNPSKNKVGEGQGWNFAYRRGENRHVKDVGCLFLTPTQGNLSVMIVVFKKNFTQITQFAVLTFCFHEARRTIAAFNHLKNGPDE